MTHDPTKSAHSRFTEWWRKPATVAERASSALLGLWAFFLMGIALCFWMTPEYSLSLEALAYLAAGTSASGLVLGALFPKTIWCICLPFSVIGISWGS